MSARNVYTVVKQGTTPNTPWRDISSATFKQNAPLQFHLAIAQWYGALTSGSAWKCEFLKRLFAVFYHGGIVFKSGNTWYDWHGQSPNLPLAAVLSFGGRILVQLPPSANGPHFAPAPHVAPRLPGVGKTEKVFTGRGHRGVNDPGDYSFWDFLNAGHVGGSYVNDRFIATHSVSMAGTFEVLPSGGKTYVAEESGTDKEGRDKGRHHGFNPRLGGGPGGNGVAGHAGDHNLSPLTGTPAAEDGTNGHVYAYFRPPTAQFCGALLVGCENCQYGKENAFTGAGHSVFGTKQAVSATGCPKWNDLPAAAGTHPSGGVGTVLCDLTAGWDFIRMTYNQQGFDPDLLDQPPQSAVNHDAALDLLMGLDSFLRLSGRKKSAGSEQLQQLDAAVQLFHTGVNQGASLYDVCLRARQYIKAKGGTGQKYPERVEAAKQLLTNALPLLQVADPIGYLTITLMN